jgi:hypothetical protein
VYRRAHVLTSGEVYNCMELVMGRTNASRKLGIWNRKSRQAYDETAGIEYDLILMRDGVEEAVNFFRACFGNRGGGVDEEREDRV